VDRGLLKPSNQPGSDVLMLDAEFTVAEGPHARRKFWQNFTVQGGKLDEQGQSIGWKISKSQFRAMIDSALGLNPEDMSEAAKAKRVLRGLADLDGITFVAKIQDRAEPQPRLQGRQQARPCRAAHRARVAKVMAGETVPAQPSNKPRPAAAPRSPQPPPGVSRSPRRGAGLRPRGRRRPPSPPAQTAAESRRAEGRGRSGLAEPVSPDEWQAHVTTEAGPCDGALARGAGAARPPHREPHPARPGMHGLERHQPLHRAGLRAPTAAPDAEERSALDLLLMG
jgi:hypothetical protein